MSGSVYHRVQHSDDDSDWNYYEEDAVTRRKTWKTRKFASFDRAGWDQAKQTISKGIQKVKVWKSYRIYKREIMLCLSSILSSDSSCVCAK